MKNSIWQIIKENADIQLIFEIIGAAIMLIGIIIVGLSF